MKCAMLVLLPKMTQSDLRAQFIANIAFLQKCDQGRNDVDRNLVQLRCRQQRPKSS